VGGGGCGCLKQKRGGGGGGWGGVGWGGWVGGGFGWGCLIRIDGVCLEKVLDLRRGAWESQKKGVRRMKAKDVFKFSSLALNKSQKERNITGEGVALSYMVCL